MVSELGREKKITWNGGCWSLVLALAHGGVACGGVGRSNGGPWWNIAFQDRGRAGLHYCFYGWGWSLWRGVQDEAPLELVVWPSYWQRGWYSQGGAAGVMCFTGEGDEVVEVLGCCWSQHREDDVVGMKNTVGSGDKISVRNAACWTMGDVADGR
ncbi:hypothetical protein Peur_049097 [Populus x canadensis]